MDTELTSVASRYYILRGLFLLPTGFLLVAGGLSNMPPIGAEPVSDSAWLFLVALAVAGVGYFVVNRYYVTTFGRIDSSPGTKWRVGALTALVTVGICVGITVDSRFDLPISTFGAIFSAAWLVYYRMIVGLRPYHWLFFGALALVSLVPIWGDVDDKVSVVMIPMGLATIGVGLFDHRELVESFRRVRSAATGH